MCFSTVHLVHRREIVEEPHAVRGALDIFHASICYTTYMKKILLGILFFFFVGTLPLPTHAEKIDSLIVELSVKQDATLSVVEEIAYDFEGEARHGIYRDIPVSYRSTVGLFKTSIHDVVVENASGEPRPFTLSRKGDFLRVKIGEEDILVNGKEVYRIRYIVDGPFLYFDDRDELYWNVLGNDWEVPVTKVLATVSLPKDATELTKVCYAGPFGAQQGCDLEQLRTDDNGVHHYDIGAFDLLPNEAVTLAISFPKGLIYEPTLTERVLRTMKDNIVLLLPIILFMVMLRLWWTKGRDVGRRNTIIPMYSAPDTLSPAEIGTIVDERVHSKDITATIIDLAVRGYIKIHQLDHKVLIFESHEYVLEKIKSPDTLPRVYERELMRALFKEEYLTDEQCNGREVRGTKLTSLKDVFAKDAREIEALIYGVVADERYFKVGPQKIRNIYTIVGVVLLIGWFLLAYAVPSLLSAIAIGSAVASALIIIVFGQIMPAKTKKGSKVFEHIQGFKLFLGVTDKDRLAFHNSPKKTPELFDAMLPFAIALGVEKAWAAQFESIYTKEPSWYSGSPSGAFSVVGFTNELGAFTSAASAAQSPASGSGASSGGGFGGGGGGSW